MPEPARRVAHQLYEARNAGRLATAETQAHEVLGRDADSLVAAVLRSRLSDPAWIAFSRDRLEAWARAAGATLGPRRRRVSRFQLLGGTQVRLRTEHVRVSFDRRRPWRDEAVAPALAQLGIADGVSPAVRELVVRDLRKSGDVHRTVRSLADRGIHVRAATARRWASFVVDHPVGDEEPRRSAEEATDDEPRRALTVDDASTFDIPIDRTPEVERWVQFFSEGRGRSTFQRWLTRAAHVQPAMRARLRAEGMPEDLVYLSMIESGYDPRAYSHADAAGLWQFIEPTARAYGLRIDDWVDERFDPERSLDAALTYLGELYGEFGDWRLAWAAYNTGPERVRRAIAKLGTSDWWVLARSSHLHPETRDYVPIIMGAAIVGHDAERLGFVTSDVVGTDQAVVNVPGLVDLRFVAESTGMASEELLAWNPALRRAATPPGGYPLSVPRSKVEALSQLIRSRPAGFEVDTAEWLLRPGESLQSVAARFQSTVAIVREVNSLGVGEPPPGIRLRIPVLPPPLTPRASKDGVMRIHVVRTGETAALIAHRYGMPFERLVALNRLERPDRIEVGQKLRVVGQPRAATATRIHRPTSGRWLTYRVRSGDSLARIARSYGVTVEDLVSWNRLTRRTVSAGQRLLVSQVSR